MSKSIRFKIMVFLIVLIITVTATFSLATYGYFRGVMLQRIERDIVNTVFEVAKYTGQILYIFFSPIRHLSLKEEMATMNWPLQRDILKAQANPFFQDVAVVDRDGYARYIDGRNLQLGDREYIRLALSGKENFSDIIESRITGEKVIMMATPIISNDGEIVGAIIGRLELSSLAGITRSLGYGDNGYSYIINEFDTIISHTNKDIVYNYSNIGQWNEQSDVYKSYYEFVLEARSLDKGIGRYSTRDQRVIMGFAKIPMTDWYLFVGSSESEAMRDIVFFSWVFALIGLAFTVLVVILAIYFSKKYSVSLIELDNALIKATAGDTSIRLKAKTDDEIGRVTNSFNVMLDTLQSLKYYDSITKLPNYNVLRREIEEKRALNFGHNIRGIMMVAIKNFSEVNEIYGVDRGDRILYEISERIKRVTVERGDVYRGKGEEIIIVISDPNISKEQVIQEGYKILLELSEPFTCDAGRLLSLNVCVGVEYIEGEISEDFLSNVTYATSIAKSHGGNRLELYNPKGHDKTRYLRSLEDELRLALEKDELYMVYQPIYDMQSGEIVSAEALIRWNHITRGMIPPDEFIAVAEKNSLISKIDYWVIDQVFKQQQIWKGRFTVSINITAKTFEGEFFVDRLIDKIGKYGLDPSKVQLELTERVVLRNIDDSIQKLKLLRSKGFKVALDDFGVGYSSLGYLIKLPINCVKIDRSFVQNIIVQKEARVITNTIVGMCNDLGLDTIAEGVENQDIVDFIKKVGCSASQGYFYSRPLPVDEFDKLLGGL